MALNHKLREALAQLDLPEDREVRSRAEMFMMRSGYATGDLAGKIGYSRVSLNLFMSGHYNLHHEREANTRLIRAKLTEFLDSCEFAEDTRPRGTLYRTSTFAAIRKAFYRALDHGWAYCIDGAPGTQKSYIAEHLVRELAETDANLNGHARRAYYIYCGENNSPQELLKMIAIEMAIPARGYIEQLIKKIQFELARRRAVIIFDEAQHLPRVTLERIRQLLDRPPYIGLIVMGSHDLQRTFADLRMEQWRRRLTETLFLPGLSNEEAERIIQGEYGKASRKQIDYLIEASIVPDFRRPLGSTSDGQRRYTHERTYQGRKYEAYLSAGALFAAIQQAKVEVEEAHAPASGSEALSVAGGSK